MFIRVLLAFHFPINEYLYKADVLGLDGESNKATRIPSQTTTDHIPHIVLTFLGLLENEKNILFLLFPFSYHHRKMLDMISKYLPTYPPTSHLQIISLAVSFILSFFYFSNNSHKLYNR